MQLMLFQERNMQKYTVTLPPLYIYVGKVKSSRLSYKRVKLGTSGHRVGTQTVAGVTATLG